MCYWLPDLRGTHRHGRDGACTRLLLCGPEAELPGSLSSRGTPSLREVRAEGWSELSPRCVGAAARRAGLSPLHL